MSDALPSPYLTAQDLLHRELDAELRDMPMRDEVRLQLQIVRLLRMATQAKPTEAGT